MALCTCSGKGKYNFHWSRNNSKLRKDGIISWGLPAYRSQSGRIVCPQASSCILGCYARAGHYTFGRTPVAREHNLDYLISDKKNEFRNFIHLIKEDIVRFPKTRRAIRIHDSGDFFHQNYFLAWVEIANEFPNIRLYGYTKMISMLNNNRHIIPDNMNLVQSVGGKQDHCIDKSYPHAVIFPTLQSLKFARYIDGYSSDLPALNGEIKVGLVYHGTRLMRQEEMTQQYKFLGIKI